MSESEAKQSVVALVQLMGWKINPSGYGAYAIKINSPNEVCMGDDWVKDVSPDQVFTGFYFHTWVSALNALCSYDRNEQLAHRP